MKLAVSIEQSKALIEGIPHETCRTAMPKHWHVKTDGDVQAQSVLWLYCWAKTGQGSEGARLAATEAFERIFSVSFSTFDRLIEHEWARIARYSPADIELDLEARLKRLG